MTEAIVAILAITYNYLYKTGINDRVVSGLSPLLMDETAHKKIAVVLPELATSELLTGLTENIQGF